MALLELKQQLLIPMEMFLATAYEGSKLYYPKVGWVEQEPEDFVTSSLNTIREILKKSKIDSKEVASLAFSGQNGWNLGY